MGLRRHAVAVCLLGSVLLLPATVRLSAQETPDPRLTEPLVRQMITLLKANILDRQRTEDRLPIMESVVQDMDQQLTARTIEPLSWLQAHGTNPILPPSARYDAECSKSVSRHHSVPTAVFSLGVSAPRTLAAVGSSESADGASAEPPDVSKVVRDQASLEAAMRTDGVTAVLASTRRFYKSRGMEDGGKGHFWRIKDHSESNLSLWIFNRYGTHDKLAGCTALPSGPILIQFYSLDAAAAYAESAGNLVNLASALAREHMTKEQYDKVLAVLTVVLATPDGLLDDPSSMLYMNMSESARAALRENLKAVTSYADELRPLLKRLFGG